MRDYLTGHHDNSPGSVYEHDVGVEHMKAALEQAGPVGVYARLITDPRRPLLQNLIARLAHALAGRSPERAAELFKLVWDSSPFVRLTLAGLASLWVHGSAARPHASCHAANSDGLIR